MFWCNGDFFEGRLLPVATNDRGLCHGLGVFETVLAIDGELPSFDLHCLRMSAGAKRLGLGHESVLVLGGVLSRAIDELLELRGLTQGRARLRISLSAGSGDLRTLSPGSDTLLWITAERASEPPESVSLVTASFPRNERSPLAGIKCLAYAENLVALDEARRVGADELLFYNTRGELCEATTSNVFLVRAGKIFTPSLSSGCLPGTMRERVLDFCRLLEWDLVEEELLRGDVEACDAAFVTSAIRGVVPVSKIDGRTLPECPGEIGGILKAARF